jgi:Xaa-Pro aminopeptidase
MTLSERVTNTEIVPDETELRHTRRRRVLDAMEEAGIDILVLGQEGNARYVSGAPRLWTAGSRAFGPGCVLERTTGAVYLLSTWDQGVPDEIPHDNLYGISFNAGTFLRALKNVSHAATARTVATDSLTGSSAKLLASAFPAAELVDAQPMLGRARQTKTHQEVTAIRASVSIAERALAAAVAALRPGTTERRLTGVFMKEMACAGVTTPSTQDVAWATSREHPWHRGSRDAPLAPGDHVAFTAGVMAGGYLGELGRTHVVGDGAIDKALSETFGRLRDRLHEACQPGTPLSQMLVAYEDLDLPAPPMPVARGLGLGFDLPLVAHALPREAASQRVEEGMVLALVAFVWKEGVGALYGQDPVLITSTGPEMLTSTLL